MPLVYRNFDYVLVAQTKTWLEAEGIPTELRNYNISSLAGEVPQQAASAELWVDDSVDLERVRTLLADLRAASSTPAPPDWTCPACGEQVPGSISECWKCGKQIESE